LFVLQCAEGTAFLLLCINQRHHPHCLRDLTSRSDHCLPLL
jgi:hypothetical protein